MRQRQPQMDEPALERVIARWNALSPAERATYDADIDAMAELRRAFEILLSRVGSGADGAGRR